MTQDRGGNNSEQSSTETTSTQLSDFQARVLKEGLTPEETARVKAIQEDCRASTEALADPRKP